MRTKLFVAFFLVIALAMLSNVVYEKLIIRDFGSYAEGTRADQLYWVMADIENSYNAGRGWNPEDLHNAMHWALMLRFQCKVMDTAGGVLITSEHVFSHLTGDMKRRMQVLEVPDVAKTDPYASYPLYSEGSRIGTLLVRDIRDRAFREKELTFKRRGKEFLLTTFGIAGGGALLLALLLSQLLSRPVSDLKAAAEAVGRGDLSVRLGPRWGGELGALKKEFNHMVETLQREDTLRNRLASNVAHELRTPLAVLKARLEAMLDGVIETGKTELEALKSETDSLAKLVAGIEDLTKAEAGFFKKTQSVSINLREFLEDMQRGMEPLFREKGLTLSIERPDAEITVSTEPEKLEKALRNILANALQYTSAGGVSISYGKEDQRFYIEVKDTGSGISREELARVFNRFHKGEDSKGFGLGLAITRELIEIMGGSVRAASTPGRGAAFRIDLPL